ncbi:MAG: helix-turn-helix domain-containing protein [Nitrospinota bacterium]
MNSLGDHIQKRRLDLGLLQREVAEVLGGNATPVHGWERGRTNPSLPFLPKIAAFLGYVPWDGPSRNLGEKIAWARRWLGISQEALARGLGVDPATVARWEGGEVQPSKKLKEPFNLSFHESSVQESKTWCGESGLKP